MGATAVGARSIYRGGKFANFMKKIDSIIMKRLKNAFTITGEKFDAETKGMKPIDISPKWFNKLKQLPASTRGIGLLGMLALPLIGYISAKHIYKSGQIDQKYTDRAKVRQHQSEVL